jgi:hypothetical protein
MRATQKVALEKSKDFMLVIASCHYSPRISRHLPHLLGIFLI